MSANSDDGEFQRGLHWPYCIDAGCGGCLPVLPGWVGGKKGILTVFEPNLEPVDTQQAFLDLAQYLGVDLSPWQRSFLAKAYGDKA